jgi:hypothetical protein
MSWAFHAHYEHNICLLCSEWWIITSGPLYVNVTQSHISRFGDFVDGICPIELEVKDTTYTDRSVSYLDLHLEIDIEEGLRTKFPDKKKRFKFSHCELSIYIYQHCSGACIWSKYLSVDPIFQSLWLLSGFPW